MIEATTLTTFIGACLVVYLMPGPDMAFIAAHAMRDGRRAGLLAATGTVTGVLVQATAAALGITAIFQASAFAFEAVRWLGVGYLAYLGYRVLSDQSADDAHEVARASSAAAVVAKGAAINMLNPKVALFFLALLPQFVDPGTGFIGLQLAMLGGIFALGALIWVTILALGFAYLGDRLNGCQRFRLWRRRVTGGSLIGFAGALALSGGARQG